MSESLPFDSRPVTAASVGKGRGTSELARGWSRFKRHKLAMGGLVFVIVLAVMAVFAPLIAPYSHTEQDLTSRLLPPLSEGHWLGTDTLGRDVLSRMIFSLRTALMIGVGAELAALAVAILIGLTAGFRGGRLDQLLSAVTDIMYAFPSYLFAIVMVVVLGRSVIALIVAIAVASWVNQARLVRAQTLKIKNFEYVEAGKAMGTSGWRISVRYILPNSMGPLLVTTSFGIPAAIVAESGLAILGLGVAPPTPSWGGMIREGYAYVLTEQYLIAAPLALLGLTLLAFTWMGDGLRDAFDSSEEDR